MLKIGISACYFHADPKRPIFKGKTLLYIEQSLAHWVNSCQALAYMIPSVNPHAKVRLSDLAQELDGLILHGGADVSPESYGEAPIQPEWSGDLIRDRYEIELFHEFLAQKKPVLGVCRGAQVMNVAFGGTLYQDIATQVSTATAQPPLVHRSWEIYDQNFHSIQIKSGSGLQKIYSGLQSAKVNSVHHQAIRDLGKNLEAEAFSEDGIVEAIRLKGETFACAVQWHPEFHDPNDSTLLSSTPLLESFLQEARRASHTR